MRKTKRHTLTTKSLNESCSPIQFDAVKGADKILEMAAEAGRRCETPDN
jgi:hypothetical protein